MSTALQAAKAYVARGWNPLPLPYKSKIPTDKGWQNRVIGAADLPKYFNGRPQNVGVVLGPSSKGLTDIDLDSREAVELAPQVLPPTGAIFGRHSAPASHWLYRSHLAAAPEQKATIQFQDPKQPKDNVMLLEVRIGGDKGAQTVFPGSVHESDEEIRWDETGDPAEIADDVLLKQVRLLASISLLARYWPGEGARHDTALSLGGFLARAGLPTPQIKYLVEAMAKTAKDPEHRDRRNTAENAAQAFHAGKPARGFTTLRKNFGVEVARQVAEWLEYRGPDDDDDDDDGFGSTATGQAAPQPPPRKSLAEVHAVFKKWFGAEYDLDAATAAMAAAASERLDGDPLWLLIVAGPGGAKTETVQALAGCGAHITSTISSEGALLSATPRKQQNKKSTGGLLRKIGDHGTLVIKDFTSILSADRNTRACVLAAIREVYDGRWERNVGTDGGQTLTWTGRIVIVAAVTTAWDAAHAVVASMGDRFALLRLRTSAGRLEAGRGAVRNTGGETAMRQELADAVGALVAHMDTTPHQLSDDEADKIVKAADLVTLARSAVERDFRGDIEFAHDPEAPTRFAKQLVQLLRGAVAIGVPPDDAMRLVRRCACDSIPPLRRDILLDLAENPGSRAADVRKRISQPKNTVRRGLECLHMLRALVCEETEETDRNGKEYTVSRYRLADGLDEETLLSVTGGK